MLATRGEEGEGGRQRSGGREAKAVGGEREGEGVIAVIGVIAEK